MRSQVSYSNCFFLYGNSVDLDSANINCNGKYLDFNYYFLQPHIVFKNYHDLHSNLSVNRQVKHHLSGNKKMD